MTVFISGRCRTDKCMAMASVTIAKMVEYMKEATNKTKRTDLVLKFIITATCTADSFCLGGRVAMASSIGSQPKKIKKERPISLYNGTKANGGEGCRTVKASIEKAMETSMKEHLKMDSNMAWAIRYLQMVMLTKVSMLMGYQKELVNTTGMMAVNTKATSSRACGAGMGAGE